MLSINWLYRRSRNTVVKALGVDGIATSHRTSTFNIADINVWPLDRCFYPHLTPMKYSYIVSLALTCYPRILILSVRKMWNWSVIEHNPASNPINRTLMYEFTRMLISGIRLSWTGKVIVGHIFETSINVCVSSDLSEIVSVCSLRFAGHNLINLERKYIFSKQILFFIFVLTFDR